MYRVLFTSLANFVVLKLKKHVYLLERKDPGWLIHRTGHWNSDLKKSKPYIIPRFQFFNLNNVIIFMRSSNNIFLNTILDESLAKGKVAAVDFKGEAMTFKATSGAVLTGLAQCIEAIAKREELWRRKLEKEHQRLLRLEESCLALRERRTSKGGPDQEVYIFKYMKPLINKRYVVLCFKS